MLTRTFLLHWDHQPLIQIVTLISHLGSALSFIGSAALQAGWERDDSRAVDMSLTSV